MLKKKSESKKRSTSVVKLKKPSTKYSKLSTLVSEDLANSKKALVSAERNLAKAKKTHEELIAKVSRLDMLERSLKAFLEGTEPPTNIKYVYNYPQWVWYPGNNWWWYPTYPTFTAAPYTAPYTTTTGNSFTTTGCNSVGLLNHLTNSSTLGSLSQDSISANVNNNSVFTLAQLGQNTSNTSIITVDLSTNAADGDLNGTLSTEAGMPENLKLATTS